MRRVRMLALVAGILVMTVMGLGGIATANEAHPSIEPTVIAADGGSAWVYQDAFDATAKREGGYLVFNGTEFLYAADGSAYAIDGGWVDQSAYVGKGPHGGYDTTTNKCKTCHATHRAEGGYYLLRASSSDDACDYCHIGGGAHSSTIVYDANPAGKYTSNGHTMGAGALIPDSTTSMEAVEVELRPGDPTLVKVRQYDAQRKSLYRIVGYGRSPAGHPTFNASTVRFARVGPTPLSCSSCHQTHNATAQIWRPQAFSDTDVVNENGFLVSGYKLLRRFPGASAVGDPAEGVAINAADLAKVPESRLVADGNYSTSVSLENSYTEDGTVTRQPDWVVSNEFAGGPLGSATVVNQYTLSVWCADCHNLNIGGTQQFAGSDELGFVSLHAERTHPVPSVAAFGGSTGGFQCYSCHRNDLDLGTGCSICHYSAANYRARVMSTGSDFPHAGSDDGYKLLGAYSWAPDDVDPTEDWPFEVQPVGEDNLDAVCIRCHNVDTGGHPPYGTGGPDHDVPEEYLYCTACHEGGDAAGIHEATVSGCEACHGAPVLTFDCGVCHPAELEPHGHEVPAPYDTLCLGCHPADNAADLHVDTASGCDACHGDGITPSLVCSDCHTVTDPPHADADHTVPAPFDVDCMGCHTADDGADLHAGTASGCSACHADGVTATLVCLECHTVVYPPPHSEVDHTADVGATADPSGKLCADCHAMDVTVEHEKTSSSTAGQSCGACHPTPRDTFDTWDQGCVQGGCHAAGSDAEQHADQTLAHTLPDDASACMGAGCHSGTDLADVHADAGTEPITACLVCHASGVPTTDSCADCHPDKLEPHGYDAEQHTADLVGVIGFVPVWDAYDGVDLQSGHGDSYFNLEPIYMPEYCLDCHSADLAVLHPDGCVTCHPTPRDTFTDWDGSCSQGGCHVTYHSVIDAQAAHTTVEQYCGRCHNGPDDEVRSCTEWGCHP